MVTVESVTDNVIGKRLLDRVAVTARTVTKACMDAGFKDDVAIHGALLAIDVEVVSRTHGEKGFRPLPCRWVVEQANGTLILHRRLVHDCEMKTASADSMVYWTSSTSSPNA